jgi:hypothetical protein
MPRVKTELSCGSAAAAAAAAGLPVHAAGCDFKGVGALQDAEG